ncbi:MAG: hypothetical protein P1U38_02960 [Aeromicrobium sp.]|uniref:hypothetical protein n=1 Tax=Aeromicrobium sp. TaxID=1871063 RepID=UPI0025BE9CAE|nr:hypothetical protein [Aeromicrobium sp.]MCK5890242.1 hypothetical protein [Aeromicrobium sp.]MDF1703712.1 hypothetical protein [Aeromicrobium sp.]
MTAAGQRQGPTLRPSLRDVQAAEASSRLSQASCVGRELEWAEGEQVWTEARSIEEALAAAAPLIEICQGCPVRAACAQWAEIDRYTGVAGGRPYVRGVHRPYAWAHRRDLDREEQDEPTRRRAR